MLTRTEDVTQPSDAPEYWARAIDAVLAASQVTSPAYGVHTVQFRLARELVAIAWRYEAKRV